MYFMKTKKLIEINTTPKQLRQLIERIDSMSAGDDRLLYTYCLDDETVVQIVFDQMTHEREK